LTEFWQFDEQDKQILTKYYFSNYFLMSCLYRMNQESIAITSYASDHWFTRKESWFGNSPIGEPIVPNKILEKIENDLFLPIAEIEKRQQSNS
jgi:hypothetical protein